jgi:hypothetical protein
MSSASSASSAPSACAFHTDGQLALNDPALNCPRLCSHGATCSYTGPGGCAFVHPGEEGTGRRLFPARTNPQTGEVQKASVRLIGSPGFYERRRLKMTWKQWCALPKNQHLRLLTLEKKQVKTQAQQKKADVWTAAKEQQQQQTRESIMLNVAARNVLGNALYAIISPFLEEVKPSLIEAGQWCDAITAGKLTGMILESNDFKGICHLLENHSEMKEVLADGCHILKTVADGQGV